MGLGLTPAGGAKLNRGDLIAFAALFVINAALNAALFLPGEFPFRGSIEGGYASMVRLFSEYPNPWGWNPTQYCGLPVQFTYLPLVPYLGALLVWLARLEPVYAYRLLTAVFACLGPATLFLLVRRFGGSRGWALATALGYTLFSPAYGLIQQIDHDRGLVQLPWRVQVLAKYGEGPHTVGLALLPLALVAVWSAATGRKYRSIFVAAVLLAAVSLANWVAALALAWCCLMLMLAFLGAQRSTGFRQSRVLAAAGLGYLLACFWLTPTFVRTVAFNWPTDAFNYHLRNEQSWLLAGLAGGALSIRLLFIRWPGRNYVCFLVLSMFGFAYVVMNYYWRGLSTIPESRRYAPEFEMFLLAALFELLRRAVASRSRCLEACALVLASLLVAGGATQGWHYVTKDFAKWRPAPKESTVEYRIAELLASRRPAGRVYATGGLRFRLNSWFDLPQIGGTFETGLRSRVPVHYAYQIRTGLDSKPGEEGADAVAELTALGVEYIVVHGPRSQEYYRDVRNPAKFEGVAEPVWREGDDAVYKLPFRSLAHLVRPDAHVQHHNKYWLRPFLAAIEDPAQPRLTADWRGPSEMVIKGPAPPGMRMHVQVSYDPGWQAWQDGRAIPVEQDQLGQLSLLARPAEEATVLLRFLPTREQELMAALSALAWLASLAGLVAARRVGVH